MTHPRSISDRLLPKGRKKGASSVSHTKTLMERASSRNQLSPLPARSLIACYRRDARKIGEGFGEWSEAPSYEEGVGVDGGIAGFCLQWGLGGNPQWVKTHIFATFSKKVLPSLSQSDNALSNCCTFAIAFEMQRRVKAAAQHSSSESRLCVHLALHLYLITRESGSDLSPGTN